MTSESSLGQRAADRQVQRLAEQLGELRSGQEQLRRELDELRVGLSLQQRAREQGRDDDVALNDLQSRIDLLEQRIESDGERARRLGDGIAELERVGEISELRLQGVEGHVSALTEASQNEREERSRIESTLPELTNTVDEAGARLTALQAQLRRAEDGLARLDSALGREEELRRVIEQQRSVRLRLEERLRELEERMQEALELLASAAEERLALRHQATGFDERLGQLAAAVEASRDAAIDHYRRMLDGDEQEGKRQIEQIEQRARRGRSLLVRLRESGELPAETPPAEPAP